MGSDHFRLLAPFYDRLIKNTDTENIIRYAELPVKGRLLDAGGGTGRVAAALEGMAIQIVVTDLSIGMLRRAATKGLHVTCSNIEKLSFPDFTFERIIMVDAIHHIHDQQAAARELWRVLAPGGKILVVEPDVMFFGVKMIVLLEKLMRMRSHFLELDAIVELFKVDSGKIFVENENVNNWIIINKSTPE